MRQTDTAAIRERLIQLIAERSFGRKKIVLASGRESNFYFDMKPTMFHPEGAALLARLIFDRLSKLDVDLVGGLEMGAVPLIATVSAFSHEAGRPIPGFFVRKAVKDHGTKKRIDGIDSVAGKKVVILEDVTTTGGSAIQAVEEVRAAGAEVVLVLSIVDRLEGAIESFEQAKVPFASLFTRRDFMKD
ncbi:MAG: orotate phosphoribosyltransferase [Bradyrhizobiaceae bacterium]|nr:orotate phosphoribosyltransferase [Bradyrhizobiaceae bacterium]